MKKLLPRQLIIFIRVLLRNFSDLRKGYISKFAGKSSGQLRYTHVIETRQAIRTTPSFENKIHNIFIATEKIEKICIQPGEIFSFWHVVGNPTAKKGYKEGRNLVGGELSVDYGGGLCQLSGIMYHTALKAGLEILERYNHSLDIYKEEERFTPLGADATIVYGYKDLRIKNNTNGTICFNFLETPEDLVCRLFSTEPLKKYDIIFEREAKDGTVCVVSKRVTDVLSEVVGVSIYKKPE